MVRLELRRGGARHPRPVGRAVAGRRDGALPLGTNPIYLAALLVVLGQPWLLRSLPLLAYAGAMATFRHLFVTGYEERALRRRHSFPFSLPDP